jgi:hypothetical protein
MPSNNRWPTLSPCGFTHLLPNDILTIMAPSDYFRQELKAKLYWNHL